MTPSRSTGVVTDADLRIELGDIGNPVATLMPIAPHLLLSGKPVSLINKCQHIKDEFIKTADSMTIDAFLQQVQEGRVLSLASGLRSIFLQELKTALFFIDDRQKQAGSETIWAGKGEGPSFSVPPVPALRAMAAAEVTQSPLGCEGLDDPMDYGNERMTNNNYSFDPSRREIRVTALTDGKVPPMTSYGSGAHDTVWPAWSVSRQQPYVAHQVRLTLPSQSPGGVLRETELISASYDDRRYELVTLDGGREADDCGVQTRWCFDSQRFGLSRYAQRLTCDNWQGPDAWSTLWIIR